MLEKQPITESKILLPPGTLWASIKQRTAHALLCGSLQSIPTEFEFVEQDGVRFLVRILANLVRKEEAQQKQEKQSAAQGKDFNPFLPYEKDLWVADISDTHVCLLNKYNVVDYHLLIITRAFEEQESLLTLQDFAALWACLAEYDGLAFYNGGKVAGASQRHKHLQLVPLPMVTPEPQIPIAPLLADAQFQDGVGTIPGLPFQHAFAKLDKRWLDSPFSAASSTLLCYRQLLQALDLLSDDDTSTINRGAYNLLATREWMLIVPRSHESYESIAVNSLGFAGALLVRNEQQMQLLKNLGVMNLLRQVGVAK
jgi:ATP adenylyltransferase